MSLIKAEQHVQACAYNKIDNRKVRQNFVETNSKLKKIEGEIASKYIPRDRRYERVQVICRLRAKLKNKKSQ